LTVCKKPDQQNNLTRVMIKKEITIKDKIFLQNIIVFINLRFFGLCLRMLLSDKPEKGILYLSDLCEKIRINIYKVIAVEKGLFRN
jgi:hypothetical protein